VFVGNFAGAFTVAFLMAIVFTYGFSAPPDKVGKVIAGIGEARTLGYAHYGAMGMLTLFVRGMLCNWMVSTGVVGTMISTSVTGKVVAMWMPIMVFFALVFEHSVVNMFLFPSALLMGGNFSIMDYMIWNDSYGAGQSGRRPRLLRPHALRDACENCAQAGAARRDGEFLAQAGRPAD
jgi:formate transporter